MIDTRRRLLGVIALFAAASLTSCAILPDAPPADVFFGTQLPYPAARAATQPATQFDDQAEQFGDGEPVCLAQRIPTTGPVAVSVEESVLLALGNNRALGVARLNPCIRQTFEQEQRAVFDPLITADVRHGRERGVSTGGQDEDSTETGALATVEQQLPTGTAVSADLQSRLITSSLQDDQRITRVGLSVTQALLRGAGLDVNLATIRQARLDTLASEYELRGFAEALVAETEQTYWDYALAHRTIQIVQDSLKLAERQMGDTRARVEVGDLAPTELAAAEAEVARRREDLINAESLLERVRLRLLRLMNPQAGPQWDRQVVLLSPPVVPAVELDGVEIHVAIAFRLRPDLNQARLLIQRGELELVKTRNGLLPRLDLFATLGKSGYAESFGRDLADLFDNDRFDVLVGARFEHPPANRAAIARDQRARCTLEQVRQALDNLGQLAQVDVRTAFIEVQRTKAQVAATAVTLKLQRETLRAETEKFAVGRSTSFLVGQAQRDLLVVEIGQVAAVVSHLKSLVELHRQDGSLLLRHGIVAPGNQPVSFSR